MATKRVSTREELQNMSRADLQKLAKVGDTYCPSPIQTATFVESISQDGVRECQVWAGLVADYCGATPFLGD
jgi:hypothetical protein